TPQEVQDLGVRRATFVFPNRAQHALWRQQSLDFPRLRSMAEQARGKTAVRIFVGKLDETEDANDIGDALAGGYGVPPRFMEAGHFAILDYRPQQIVELISADKKFTFTIPPAQVTQREIMLNELSAVPELSASGTSVP